ncbi:MAG: hypothetical protein KDB07_00635 [Planctomycetes bacterium]|nr:hypothetical protein [Planctomycetota bacterium]
MNDRKALLGLIILVIIAFIAGIFFYLQGDDAAPITSQDPSAQHSTDDPEPARNRIGPSRERESVTKGKSEPKSPIGNEQVNKPEPREPKPNEKPAQKDFSLRLIVIAKNGGWIEGALAWIKNYEPSHQSPVTTDAKGQALIHVRSEEPLSAFEAKLEIVAIGYLPFEQWITLDQRNTPQEVVVELSQGKLRVSGSVENLDSKRVPEGVKVKLEYLAPIEAGDANQRWLAFPAQEISKKGVFEFEGLVKGQYRVFAEPPGSFLIFEPTQEFELTSSVEVLFVGLELTKVVFDEGMGQDFEIECLAAKLSFLERFERNLKSMKKATKGDDADQLPAFPKSAILKRFKLAAGEKKDVYLLPGTYQIVGRGDKHFVGWEEQEFSFRSKQVFNTKAFRSMLGVAISVKVRYGGNEYSAAGALVVAGHVDSLALAALVDDVPNTGKVLTQEWAERKYNNAAEWVQMYKDAIDLSRLGPALSAGVVEEARLRRAALATEETVKFLYPPSRKVTIYHPFFGVYYMTHFSPELVLDYDANRVVLTKAETSGALQEFRFIGYSSDFSAPVIGQAGEGEAWEVGPPPFGVVSLHGASQGGRNKLNPHWLVVEENRIPRALSDLVATR